MNSKRLAVFAASMQWAGLWVVILAVRTVKKCILNTYVCRPYSSRLLYKNESLLKTSKVLNNEHPQKIQVPTKILNLEPGLFEANIHKDFFLKIRTNIMPTT